MQRGSEAVRQRGSEAARHLCPRILARHHGRASRQSSTAASAAIHAKVSANGPPAGHADTDVRQEIDREGGRAGGRAGGRERERLVLTSRLSAGHAGLVCPDRGAAGAPRLAPDDRLAEQICPRPPGATPSFYTVIGCHSVGIYTVVLLAVIAVIFCQNDSVALGYPGTLKCPSRFSR
jgi:hypothetical protein